MEEKIAYLCFAPHLKRLRAFGFYHLDPNSPKWNTWHKYFHAMYMRISLFLSILYMTQQIIYVYQVRRNIDKIMDSMFLLLSYSDSIYKQFVFWTKGDKIEDILDILKGSLFNQKEQIYQKLLTQRARQSEVFLIIFNLMALSTCILWSVLPLILYLKGELVEFAIWLPFDANVNPRFYYTVIYIYLQTSWTSFNNTTMDAFITYLLAQCKTQLSILRLDLENLVKNSKEEAISISTSYRNVLGARFNKILYHYKEIVDYAKNIQEVFGGVILFQFLISGWIICTTAYAIVNINPLSVEFLSMLMYMSCILTELFLYCYFGNEVTYESLMLMDSIYNMDWLEMPLRHRQNLIIFMERIKRPIEPKAGLIIPLSANTFVMVLRSSYTFYTFLSNTN